MANNILLDSLQMYYLDKKNASKLLEILKEGNRISLRIIDWFVTNYSKKNNIYYSIFETPKKKKTFIQTCKPWCYFMSILDRTDRSFFGYLVVDNRP